MNVPQLESRRTCDPLLRVIHAGIAVAERDRAPPTNNSGRMNPLALAALLGAVGAFPSDGGLTPPKDMPAFYRDECGTCHLPYPPNLLSAGGKGWRTIMSDLRSHYGEDSTLEEPVRRQIEHYLLDHAATSDRRFGSRSDPPRLTTTLWFRRNHGGMKPHFGMTGGPANCQACQPRAAEWRYAKEEVVQPKPLRR